MLGTMDNGKTVQVVVAMRVRCWCGFSTDEEFLLDMPHDKAQSMQVYEPGKCPDCGGLIRIHVKRTSALH